MKKIHLFSILIIFMIIPTMSAKTTNYQVKSKLASKYFDKHDVISLENLVNKWIKESPGDMKMEPYFWKGKLYILQNKIDEGLLYLSASARDDPKNASRWKYLIETCLINNKLIDASLYIKEAKTNLGFEPYWLDLLEEKYKAQVSSSIPSQESPITKKKETKKEKFEDMLTSWINANIMDYIHANGIYSDVKNLPNGGYVYIFLSKSEGGMPIFGDNGDISGGGSYSFYCKIELETNSKGKIISWRYEGNNCF